MLKSKKLILILVSFLLLNACDEQQSARKSENLKQSPKTVKLSPQAISLNNKGVGEMGSFDYTKATSTFEKLSKENPKWNIAQQNLAIALLNRQKPGDEEHAMQIATSLSAQDDSNLVAHYIVGILKFNQGLCDEALPHFDKVINADDKDAYALYFTGQCHLQNGKVQAALELYQKAIKADNYLRSAYYGGFMAAQRLEKPELAKKMLGDYQKMASNPKARLAEIKYTRMGPKATARAVADSDNSLQSHQPLSAPFFNAPQVLTFKNIENFGVVNLNQSNETQLYTIAENKLHLYQNFLGSAHEYSNLSIELKPGVHQLAWGDVNNDNKIDVYVTAIKDQLYLQKEQGFVAVDMDAFGLSALNSKAVRLSDADHDGDLDILLLSQEGKFEIWNNNLDNTFTALSKKTHLPPEMGYNRIFIQDIDSDRDIDIILQGKNKFVTLLNDRMWDYELLYAPQFSLPIDSIGFSNNNINGLPEINVFSGNKEISSYEFDRQLNDYVKINTLNHFLANNLLQLDVNGDGMKEFLLSNEEGIKVYNSSGKIQEQIMLSNITQVKVLNTLKGPELLVLQNKNLIHVPANDNRAPFILFNLSGKEDDANSVRSNYSGIGTEFIIRNENFYALGNSFHNLTGVDQDYQAISLAAGKKSLIDYIALEWSDGVYQTELGLEVSQYYKITETQRQLSSCPVIFAWNNGQYEFISDVLGVGGIGFAIGRHEYGEPRPWENYLLTANQLSSKEGVFKLQFTEPMEESAYLDEFQIEVIDIPERYHVLLDERMGISTPKVTGDIIFYQNKISPVRVLNKNNKDVTNAALSIDKVAIEIDNNDSRFLGLVDEQIITMEFAQYLQGHYQFVMNGWVEYGYSQTMFAAWQAGKIAQAPTLEYFVDGQWQVLLKEFGYPAGMPRSASVAIHIPQKTQSLRIRTNMEVYFDELALVKPKKIDNVVKHTLTLQSAQLKQLGFPQRTNNAQRVPSYDASQIKPFWDTRYMEGAYTQLGEIKPLVEKHDNALAIIGAGEAIEFNFIDDLPVLSDGFERYFLLKFAGWAKDMDILTQNGETIAPIPIDGAISEQAKKLNLKYNTRFKAGK